MNTIGVSNTDLVRANAIAKYMYENTTIDDEETKQEMYVLGLMQSLTKAEFKHKKLYFGLFDNIGYTYADEIYACMEPNIKYQSEALKLLNMAELQISSNGRYIGYEGRLKEIKDMYGEESQTYKNAMSLYRGYNKETVVLLSHCNDAYVDFIHYKDEVMDRSLALKILPVISRNYEFEVKGYKFLLSLSYDASLGKSINVLTLPDIEIIFNPYILDIRAMNLMRVNIQCNEQLKDVFNRYKHVSRIEFMEFKQACGNNCDIYVTTDNMCYQYYNMIYSIERN